MAKRALLVALLAVLLLLSACGIEPPVFVTATPEGTPFVTATLESTLTDVSEPTSTATIVKLPTLVTTQIAPTRPSIPTAVPTAVPGITTNTPIPTTSPTQGVGQSCTRLFYNVNGQGLQDESELMRHTDTVHPCTVLVMDSFGLAVKFAQRGIITVVRTFSAGQGSQCLTDDPVNQVRRYKSELDSHNIAPEVRARLYYYGCSNEPSYGQNNTLQQILTAEIAGMTEANQLGIHVCSGNWGVGNFDPNHVDSGLYDQYLRVLVAGGHILCVHEYTSLTLAFGVGTTMSRQCLLEPACVQPNNWATRAQIQPRRIFLPMFAQNVDSEDVPFGYAEMLDYYSQPRAQANTGLLPPYWHLFRVYWLFIRADELGIARPKVIITEGLHDHLDDINRQEPQALQILDDRWGMIRFDWDLRGAPAHCNLWEHFYYPQWTCEEAYLQQLLWWDSIANENILGVNIFTWSYNDHWVSFDLSNRQFSMNVAAFRRIFEACYGVIPHCQFTRAA